MVRNALKLWPYFLVIFLYFATSPYHRGLNNPNEMVRVYMTKAMVDDGTMAIDQVIRQWGGVDDKAIRDGKMYSSKAPLQSLLGVPAYAITKDISPDKRIVTAWMRALGSVIYGLIIAFLLLAYCRRQSLAMTGALKYGNALGITLAFGTMLYPYAITFTGHILAALTAGGTYLAIIKILKRQDENLAWFRWAVLAGLCAGAAPFAEYPAALVAAPTLVGGFILVRGWPSRGQYFGGLAVGGLPPFFLGLWAHHESWGAFYKTGYSFLENKAYVEVHGSGFFGVNLPRWDAFLGSLFSPGTGLFFFSPILLLGLLIMIARIIRPCSKPNSLGRGIAIIGLLGCIFEFFFIAGHTGWRGGWTLGPRYIIAVVPVFAVWVIEGLAYPKLRPWIAALSTLSICLTGFAAALYPHLSDVYTNPIASFLWPSYAQGQYSYGLAHSLGMSGHAANLIHLIPLFFAIGFVISAFTDRQAKSLIISLVIPILCLAGIFTIPERDQSAALRENERLWGFWEPSRERITDLRSVYRARDKWRGIQVDAVLPATEATAKRTVRCRRKTDRCEYGGQEWQHFKPDFLPFNGEHESVLFIHPITGWTVRARVVVPARAISATLYLGLSDPSADSDNRTPVTVHLKGDEKLIETYTLQPERGLKTYKLDFSQQRPRAVSLEFETAKDGARVLGWDLSFFDTPSPAESSQAP